MDPTRATSPAGSNDTPPPDLPHSMLFVPKFTKAREPRPLNRDGTPSDLRAFRIDGDPGLGLLPIARERPPAGSRLILVGNGHDRGAATFWRPAGRPIHPEVFLIRILGKRSIQLGHFVRRPFRVS